MIFRSIFCIIILFDEILILRLLLTSKTPQKNDFHIAQEGWCSKLGKALAVIAVTVTLGAAHLNTALAASYPDNGDGTILDQHSGLVWQQADSYHELKKGMNWYEALEYVDLKNYEKFAGFEDWRLPTLNELKQLYDSSRPIKSKDNERIGLPETFKDGGSYYLWTNTERGLNNAWYFGLGFKEEYFNLKDLGDLDQGVKMVRGRSAKN